MKAAALRAQELYPREPEWQRVYGDQPASVVGDAFTPHIAIYGATWHLQKKRPEPARELLRFKFFPFKLFTKFLFLNCHIYLKKEVVLR